MIKRVTRRRTRRQPSALRQTSNRATPDELFEVDAQPSPRTPFALPPVTASRLGLPVRFPGLWTGEPPDEFAWDLKGTRLLAGRAVGSFLCDPLEGHRAAPSGLGHAVPRRLAGRGARSIVRRQERAPIPRSRRTLPRRQEGAAQGIATRAAG